MINFKKLISKYIPIDDEIINNINSIADVMNIKNENLTVFLYNDLGIFCKFLPLYMENNHTREELIYINNEEYIRHGRLNKQSKTINTIFEYDKPYILIKKVVHLKYPSEHYILNLYKPEKYNI